MLKKVLIIDDEPDIHEFLRYNLTKEGYEVESSYNGYEGLIKAREFMPHLILIDVMMPQLDGIETCKLMRADNGLKNTLIVFLSARHEDFSQLAGFEAGADDYITKPIKPKLLLSKISAMLKRQNGTEGKKVTTIIPFGDYIVDLSSYTVRKGKITYDLPRKEFEILSLLLSVPGKVFSRQEILDGIWGNEIIVVDRTVDVHIRKIREKLGDEIIKTIKGVGYKLNN
ncbi:MAG TPA: response regulator transcription factor [Bacteroidia bacterium]|nr:response regulator transcription factor [Bacteroidia bacterium]HNT80291.1 response regulator transcription factor [Bacteroidia bacterium]